MRADEGKSVRGGRVSCSAWGVCALWVVVGECGVGVVGGVACRGREFWHKWIFFFAAFGGDEENFGPFSRVFINKSAEKRGFLPNFAQKSNFFLEIAKKWVNF